MGGSDDRRAKLLRAASVDARKPVLLGLRAGDAGAQMAIMAVATGPPLSAMERGMTAALFERIRDETMIHVRDDGNISYDSRLEHLMDADVLQRLLTIVGDNIMDSDDGFEDVHWLGVEDDCRKEGLALSEWFRCTADPSCGAPIKVDEDGCCTECGADAVIEPAA